MTDERTENYSEGAQVAESSEESGDAEGSGRLYIGTVGEAIADAINAKSEHKSQYQPEGK